MEMVRCRLIASTASSEQSSARNTFFVWRAICRLLSIFGARCLFRSYYSIQPKLKISEVLIPWILVALYDANIAFSVARKMNTGEIPFKESRGVFFWGYPLFIIIWTLMIIGLLLSFGMA
jgi:magnesium-transporting ATPase (P-type)